MTHTTSFRDLLHLKSKAIIALVQIVEVRWMWRFLISKAVGGLEKLLSHSGVTREAHGRSGLWLVSWAFEVK